MRNMTRWVALVVVSAALVAASATAQGQGQGKGQGKGGFGGQGKGQFKGGGFGGGFGGGGSMLNLLTNEGVQTELKMTDDQKIKATDYVQEQMPQLFQAMTDAGGFGDPAAQAKFRKDSNQAAEKFAKDTLKPDQAKRLKGIYYQNSALTVLTEDEALQKDLNLTADQKTKIKGHNEKLTTDRTSLLEQMRGGGGGDPTQMFEKLTALNKEYTDKAVAELTDAQKTKWKDLVGAPFTVQGGFRGRRGGGM
jgi:hypothetical protein